MRHGSQVSRGDLLRSLQLYPTLAAQQLAAPLLGFVLPTPPPQSLAQPTDTTTPRKQNPTPDESEPTQPSHGQAAPEWFYAVQTRQHYATPESSNNGLPAAVQGVPALHDDDLQPWSDAAPLPWQAILPAPRLSEFLRQTLVHSIGRCLDVPKLVKHVATLKMLSQLPRKARLIPAGRVVVLVDLNPRMRPFWQDARQLCVAIARKHGRSGLDIRVLDDQPLGEYWDLFDDQQQLRPWQPLQAQSVVLIISDLGQLAGAEAGVGQHWLALLQQCHRQSIIPVVLAPISPAQQDQTLHKQVRHILWNKHSRLQIQRKDADLATHQQAVNRVLGLLSIAAHVEPELLRAVLACLPARQADSGIEAAVWLHEDVMWGYTALSLKPDKRNNYQQRFKQEPAELQQQVLSLLKAQHSSQFPAVWAEEVLNAQPLVNFALDELADVARAEQFMLRLTRRYHDNQGENALGHYARRHLQRLGAASKCHYRDYASALYGLAYQDDIRQGAAIPLDYDAAIVQSVSGQAVTPQTYYLLQLGEQLLITPQPSSFNGLQTGVVLAEFIAARDSVSVAIQGEDCTRQLPLLSAGPAPCIPLTGAAISLYTGLEQLQLLPIPKPSWAYAITHSSAGLNAYLAVAGQHYAFTWQAVTSLRSAADTTEDCHWRLNETTDKVGFDRYGLYAVLSLGKVTQRFRWLNPGTFWMGSPENEPEREWNGSESGKGTETRHQVTLTQGFWMADTTVTQAFWQAVMGDNPSRFKDHPKNPVEQVSWDDAQAFIDKLNSLFPGLQARLPSDAQWEYACRAGTDTAFSFGANITTEQVNYDGEYPYADGKEGLYRKQTVPVKSLPANDRGLYEMHGNVWEWCADGWQQNLSSQPVTDPLYTAAADDSARVVRGGSWDFNGRSVRSAFRSRNSPDYRNFYLGFRLALGHAGLRPGQGVATGASTGRRVAEQRQTVPAPVADGGIASKVTKRIKKSSSKSKKKK